MKMPLGSLKDVWNQKMMMNIIDNMKSENEIQMSFAPQAARVNAPRSRRRSSVLRASSSVSSNRRRRLRGWSSK